MSNDGNIEKEKNKVRFMENYKSIRKEKVPVTKVMKNEKDVAKENRFIYKGNENDDGEDYVCWADRKE
jgi:hypothetical protein